MSSNHYNAYNYPYQQSSAQEYSTYQTIPPPNNVAQAPRQYQHPPTTQGSDYMSYQAHSYGAQGSGYGDGRDNSWNGSNYSGNREMTSRAAEVLRDMSNNAYAPNTTGATQSGFTATNTATPQTTHYSTSNSHSPRMQSQQTHAVPSTYGQTQNRPHSVNTQRAQQVQNRGLPSPATMAGHPSQRAQALYNQQAQRSASPAQTQYNTTAPSSARNNMTTAAATQADYDRRQLANAHAPRANHNTASSTSFSHGNTTAIPPGPIAPPVSSAPETYTGQGSTTVDPLAVYDPWSEYQRKQEVLRAQKAAEDEARAEVERKAEEQRKAEEAREAAEKEKEERQRQIVQQENTQEQQGSSAGSDAPSGAAESLEAEIRAMMARMRELNGKDPALLARIWEEERRAKAASPSVQNKSAAPTTVAAPPPANTTVPPAAKPRKNATPSTSVAKLVPPAPATSIATASARPQAQASSSARQGGNTIWPPEKKNSLAAAAAAYLNSQNPTSHTEAAQILTMLDGNPSYIELCEQLEQGGFKLDRAAFAKNLLSAVPDVNAGTRKTAPQPAPVYRPQVPPAVMKAEMASPAAGSPSLPHSAVQLGNSTPQQRLPDTPSFAATPAPVAEMVPIKPELKQPANKEEAARKRNLSELVDLTLLSDDEDMGPPPKKLNIDPAPAYISPYAPQEDTIMGNSEPALNNFPVSNVMSSTVATPTPPPLPTVNDRENRRAVVEYLDKRKALRRNSYNPATIARDVLLACGRHPYERQLNQHLDALRTNLPHVGYDSDLSTIRWDLIDPGAPPKGYFKDSIQDLTEDADDEDDSDKDEEARPRAQSNAIGGEGGARAQALPEAINPFQAKKKRGRPSKNTPPATPIRSPSANDMNARVASPGSAGVGYSAFQRPVEYGPDGQPLPKKRGRPVGWRKSIHGSAAAQSRPSTNGHTGKHQPSQPSSLRKETPLRIDSRSPSAPAKVPRIQSYKCKWQGCMAELHNLETLKKHVHKVHRKPTLQNTLECLWLDCGKEVTQYDANTGMRLEQYTSYAFDLESNWRDHIQQSHFDPLSWEFGDGLASGLSDTHDSEAYLSDAQGRSVTPRLTADVDRVERDYSIIQIPSATPRGRGRPTKVTPEQEVRDAQERLFAQNRRIGGPGMDRGGATLVNDKRRRGLSDGDGTEEELVDVED